MFKAILVCVLPLIGFTEQLDVAKISEAMGHMIGKNLEMLGLDFDIDAIVKGLKEESEGKVSPLNDDECVQAITELQEAKINTLTDQELKLADTSSNGDQINDDENNSLSTPNPSKHR
jgi:hypothetical protein